MATPANRPSYVNLLATRLGAQWRHLSQCRENTVAHKERLNNCVASLGTPDTSVVVFGSIAREEVTSSSDVDWILLVDGQSVPEHKAQEAAIAREFENCGFAKPGTSGVFGCMVGSHDLVHTIGGETISIRIRRGAFCSCLNLFPLEIGKLTIASGVKS